MTNSTAWLCLLIAGGLEIIWAVSLRYTYGFTKLWPSLGVGLVMAVSFYLLSQALKILPMGTAYGVWTGIGAAGAAIIGILMFHEPASAIRIVCLVMVVAGITGLKIFS